jgi:hypothetical protein
MSAAVELGADDARKVALRAQALIGAPDRRGGVPALLRHLGAVQLDTISVLARSHELIAYARLGALGRDAVEDAYWNGGSAFEYWAHAACVLPLDEWPLFDFRRRAYLARGHRWHRMADSERSCRAVLDRLRADGPLTATDLGGAKNGGPWWDWSDTKIAVEWLLDTGEVICARRTGWRRVYDLPERVLPAALLGATPTDAECVIHLAGVAARALGVVTRADLADYQRLRYGGTGQRRDGQAVTPAEAAEAAGLIPVEIAAGRGQPARPAWADPAALEPAPRGRHRTTLLSPFDSLIWDRKRTLRVFGFEHSLEAYVPAAKRVHGYFTMPLLAGGQLAGRVDPARSGSTLIARKLTLDKPAAAEPMARALTEAASWAGCDSVELQRVEPEGLRSRLTAALTAG